MVARSQPVGVKLKPDPPQDDAERLELLRKLREKERRLLDGLTRTHCEIVELEKSQTIATYRRTA